MSFNLISSLFLREIYIRNNKTFGVFLRKEKRGTVKSKILTGFTIKIERIFNL